MDRRSLLPVLAALILVAAIVAAPSAGKLAVVSEGNTRMAFNAGISPQTLPAERHAPAALVLSTKVSALDGGYPKALRRLLFEADSHLALDLQQTPVCRYAQIKDPEADRTRCSRAVVGNGLIYFGVASTARSPIIDNGTLAVFNGGVIRGNRRLWLRYTTPGPAGGTVVDSLEVKRFRSGPYRSLWTLSITQAAGGSVSLQSLTLRLRTGISATCPTGKSRFAATGEFCDGSRLIAHTAARCTPG